MDIYTYKNGEKCAHCVWISEKAHNLWYIPKIPPKIRSYTLEKQGKIQKGCTIFPAYEKFPYSFNCVYGYKNNLNNHCTYDFSTLINCATSFIEDLNDEGINETRILISSHFSSERFREKEHIHCFVTMNSPESEKVFNKTFNTTNGLSKYHKKNTKTVPKIPDEQDIKIKISEKDCKKLLRCNDLLDFIEENYRVSLKYFDSFYVFLTFYRDENYRGKVSGIFSYAPKIENVEQ